MKKIYSEELQNKQLKPKESTIDFLLNYSKSIKSVQKEDDEKILLHLN